MSRTISQQPATGGLKLCLCANIPLNKSHFNSLSARCKINNNYFDSSSTLSGCERTTKRNFRDWWKNHHLFSSEWLERKFEIFYQLCWTLNTSPSPWSIFRLTKLFLHEWLRMISQIFPQSELSSKVQRGKRDEKVFNYPFRTSEKYTQQRKRV